ncbi:alpha/beta hydrolase [Roseospira marina]|uniref:Alpha/beta hydrolase n=1 Tax=Roseospira marina TaxID=140057 RepID=A0A5M6IFN8_9PROT|nr:alpha/beta hydrolase [Roseospira marina]KAA5606398.1 alpha/beta hydrolase [Roseospira marina]MBB4314195.1 pimeloyl-ACP methyl ester carboxylesterase [Roseospira marina]MBB5087356.1 pimeloyl-ACP methyl ester carboxylesterase [Roseospira marina]
MTQDTDTTGGTRFLEVEGGRIAYDDSGGDGPLIVTIPGMGDLRSEYRHLSPRLRQAGFRVVTMDVRGFGETSATWNDYSARAVGGDALALVKHLGAGKAVILGNSFAAGSALWAARDAPDRVRGVVLLGPIVRDGPISPTTMLAFQVGFAGPWRTEFWAAYWDALFPTRKPDDHDAYRAQLVANLGEPGRMDALLAMLGLSKAETATIVSQSHVPALVVMGSLDPDFDDPAAEANWLAGQIGAESLIIEGAGHYPHAEMPEQVAPKLHTFVRALSG